MILDALPMTTGKISADLQAWIDARERHRLSHAQVRMARELGLDPKTLGKIDNHGQEPWKAPLPAYIEELYRRRFGRDVPTSVASIEEGARADARKKAARRQARALRHEAPAALDLPPAIAPTGEET